MTFVFLHVGLSRGSIVLNTGLVGLKPFDLFPFVMLAMIAPVEAIFLSTFVLISQNRQAWLAERRAELELQISLLGGARDHPAGRAPRGVAEHLGVEGRRALDLDELK